MKNIYPLTNQTGRFKRAPEATLHYISDMVSLHYKPKNILIDKLKLIYDSRISLV